MSVSRELALIARRLLGRVSLRPWEMNVESPSQDAWVTGSLDVSGWVFHRSRAATQIEVYVDGEHRATVVATRERPDVAKAFADESVRHSGFHTTVRLDDRRTCVVDVHAMSSNGDRCTVRRTVNVTPAPSNPEPVVASQVPTAWLQQFTAFVIEWGARHGRAPSILDWTAERRVPKPAADIVLFAAPE